MQHWSKTTFNKHAQHTMSSCDMEIQALKVIDGYEIDRGVSMRFAKKAMKRFLFASNYGLQLNYKEVKYITYLMAHYLFSEGWPVDLDFLMSGVDKRKTSSWWAAASTLSNNVQKRLRREEAEMKLNRDICYTSLHDWNWKKDTKTFEVTVRDKAEKLHNFVIFDGSDTKTIWKRAENGLAWKVGLWIGDGEEECVL